MGKDAERHSAINKTLHVEGEEHEKLDWEDALERYYLISGWLALTLCSLCEVCGE